MSLRSGRVPASSRPRCAVFTLAAVLTFSIGPATPVAAEPDDGDMRSLGERLFDYEWVAKQVSGKSRSPRRKADPPKPKKPSPDATTTEPAVSQAAADDPPDASPPVGRDSVRGRRGSVRGAAPVQPTQSTEATRREAAAGTIADTRSSASALEPKRARMFLEDVTNTIRLADFHTLTVSHHDPETAYVATWDGYLLKTTDGGQSWDESRLIVERRGFYGDSRQPLYFGWQRNEFTWAELHRGGNLMHAEQLLRKGEVRRVRGNALGYRPVRPGGEGRVSESENRNFGVGLPGRAPRLQNVVRRFGKPTAGLNIKQTLLLRGVMPSTLQFIVVHPHDHKMVFACSHFGLFISEDAGLNWVRVWGGENPNTRMVLHLAVDPTDGDRVLMGTKGGLYISRDRGKVFQKATAQGVGEGTINWLQYSPYDPRVVFACTDYGLLRSKDGGRSWEWIYFTTFPAARVVRYVHIDPFDKTTGYIATNDGLFWTKNILTATLEDWKRLGGLAFTGHEMSKITLDSQKRGHMWALTNIMLPSPIAAGLLDAGGSYVWESFDSGHTWRVLFSGNTKGRVAWFENDPRDPGELWIVFTRSLSRLRRKPRAEVGKLDPERRRALVSLLRHETVPAIGEVIIAATRYAGFEAQRQLQYRKLSRLRSLIPRVDLAFSYIQSNIPMLMTDAIYLSALPFRFRETASSDRFEFNAILSWDLMPAIFTLDTVLFGRIDRLNGEARAITERAMHRFYGEYVRLRARMLVDPPQGARLQALYLLRLEELSSYIDFMTGGYLTRYRRGDKPRGWDTPHFERWPGTGTDLQLTAAP